MTRRTWTADEKLAIVVAGLRNHHSIAELCREHQLSQTQYYKWRDQFWAGALKGLTGAIADPEHQQRRELERLERIIGKQTVIIETLKKSLTP